MTIWPAPDIDRVGTVKFKINFKNYLIDKYFIINNLEEFLMTNGMYLL